MTKLAFLGLGVMGYPMAGHLQAAGHEVCVYNRTTSKAEKWVGQHGGTHAPTPREAAEGADFVMSCVGNDDDLRSVCLGEDGAFAGMKAGATFVDQLYCRIQFRKLNYEGAFTPITPEPTLVFPGYYGGYNWGGASADGARDVLILNDIRIPQLVSLVAQDPEGEAAAVVPLPQAGLQRGGGARPSALARSPQRGALPAAGLGTG